MRRNLDVSCCNFESNKPNKSPHFPSLDPTRLCSGLSPWSLNYLLMASSWFFLFPVGFLGPNVYDSQLTALFHQQYLNTSQAFFIQHVLCCRVHYISPQTAHTDFARTTTVYLFTCSIILIFLNYYLKQIS